MARERSSKLDQIRTVLDQLMAEGFPEELMDLFTQLRAGWDNANQLQALFGVVDAGSVARADELYREFMYEKGLVDSRKKPTYH